MKMHFGVGGSLMIQQFLEWLSSIGIPGLFVVMFLEGASLPFPGIIIVFSYGYIIAPGYIETIFIALGMSIFYSIASLIPYFIGLKLEEYLPTRLRKGIKKGISIFHRYGIWSIAISRPFGVGNYISYVAGISNVHLFKYFALTFLGIFPWSYLVIILGDYFHGNYEVLQQHLQSFSIYGYILIAVVVIITIFLFLRFNQRKKNSG